MKIFTLKRELVVLRSRQEVFAFFSRPENLSKITPPSMNFEILTPGPIDMHPGVIIDYSVKIMGLRTHWRTMISRYDPPHSFVDEQLKGPYTFWHHTHRFEDHERGTRIIDEVKYIMPFGWAGRFVHYLLVRRQLDKIFDYRTAVISSMFDIEDTSHLINSNRRQ